MSDTFVQVLAQWDDGNPLTPSGSGNYELIASGLLMDSSAVAVVTPVILGQLDSEGAFSLLGIASPVSYQSTTVMPNTGIPLLASDNFGPGEFNWNFKIIIQGAQNITAANIPVNYSNGATQGLFTILAAAGWAPTVPPAF